MIPNRYLKNLHLPFNSLLFFASHLIQYNTIIISASFFCLKPYTARAKTAKGKSKMLPLYQDKKERTQKVLFFMSFLRSKFIFTRKKESTFKVAFLILIYKNFPCS